MSEEDFTKYDQFEARMIETYPRIFSAAFGGFACGEGWWTILEKLCENIQYHINYKNEQHIKHGRGAEVEQVIALQIKEKFGGLRFYYSGGDSEIAGMVRMAEAWAGNSCEVCGAPGTRGGNGWIRTLCPTHRAEADALYKERFGSN